MTFDDDFLRLEFTEATRDVRVKSLGLEWPPPKLLEVLGIKLRRVSMSQITDVQRAGMTHIVRGAHYKAEGVK